MFCGASLPCPKRVVQMQQLGCVLDVGTNAMLALWKNMSIKAIVVDPQVDPPGHVFDTFALTPPLH